MNKTEKAQKARDEIKSEYESANSGFEKMKESFSQEWSQVVERSLKQQQDDTIVIQAPTRLDTQQSTTRPLAEEKKSAGETYSDKLRSTVARGAWGIARDTGYIHVSLQRV